MRANHAIQIAGLTALMCLVSCAAPASSPKSDLLLIYNQAHERTGITVYNPAAGEKYALPITSEINWIVTSGDGRIAYALDNDIWVLDVLNGPDNPTNITQTPDEQEWFVNWTPDGSLLQYQVGAYPGPYRFYSFNGTEVIDEEYSRIWNENGWSVALIGDTNDDTRLYVWHGQTRIELTLPVLPAAPVWHQFLWSPNNHLFITIGYSALDDMGLIGATEIFYWNRSIVREIANPTGDETFMLGDWSNDGRLTLYTSHDGFDRWYVWDGVSFTPDGVPHTTRLTAINEAGERIDDIQWMPDGRLAIVAHGNPASDTLLGHPFQCPDPCAPQVYLWDAQTLRQVTANDRGSLLVDVHDSGSIAVSEFNGIFKFGVTVFDSSLQPVFETPGSNFASRWSKDGHLAYCVNDDLLVWDGQNTTVLSERTDSKWLLAPSRSMTCSSG